MAQGLVVAGTRITPTILNRIWGYGDGTNHTVTAASYTDLSSVLTVAAGDPQVGDGYEVEAWGTGTWGSTQQALSFAVALAGTAGTGTSIASTAFSASAAFAWSAQATILCITAGSSGAYSTKVSGVVSETANALLPATAADNTVPFVIAVSSVSENTTTTMNFSIQSKWASTTGAPTLTCVGTLYKKVTQHLS